MECVNVQDGTKKLIDALRDAKAKSEVTQEELAQAAGCTVDTIKNIFAGKISCANFLTICEIFKKLGISIDQFAEIPLRVDTRSHMNTLSFTATLNALNAAEARTDAAHRETIQLLQGSIANYKTALADARARWELREKKLNGKNMRITIALYAIIFAWIVMLIVDFLNPTVGWWRGHLSDAVIQITQMFRRG